MTLLKKMMPVLLAFLLLAHLAAVPVFAASVVRIELQSSHYGLAVGETYSTIVTAVYSDSSRQDITALAQFSSSDSAVASVDDAGTVTALAEGKAIIHASYEGYQAAASVLTVEITGEEEQRVLFQDFEEENTAQWRLLPQGTGKSALASSGEQVRSGARALKLTYNFSQTGTSELAGLIAANWNRGIKLPGQPDSIGVWVYGDNSGYLLELDLMDAQGEVFQYGKESMVIDWSGWRYVRFSLSSPAGKYGGNGIADQPLHFFQLFITKTASMADKQGAIYVDDLELIYEDPYADVKSIKLNNVRYALAAGESFNTVVSGTRADGSVSDLTPYAEYYSSNPAVATVDTAGRVMAQSPGEAVIQSRFRQFQASAAVQVVAVTGEPNQKIVFQSFESRDEASKWMLLPQGAGKSALSVSEEQAHSGAKALKLDYHFRENVQEMTGFLASNWQTGLRLPGTPDKVGIWVYGDRSGYSLELNLMDSGKEVFAYGRNVVKVDWEGWKYIQFAISRPSTSYGGDGNRQTDLPMYFFQVLITKKNSVERQGSLYFDDIQLVYHATGNEDDIVGGIGDGGDYSPPPEPQLTDVPLPAPAMDAAQPSQWNNANGLTGLVSRHSHEIGDNISGMALTKSNNFFYNTPEVKSPEWGSYWLIDGDTAGHMNTVFSSRLHSTADAQEWAQVEMDAVRVIDKVVLKARAGGIAFPLDFAIQVSRDGASWTTVVSRSDYGPVESDEPQVFEFPETEARYVRVTATRLKSENGAYYFQLKELEVYKGDSINYALAQNGGTASAANSLGGDYFDYDEFYGSMFEAGVKWLLLADGTFYNQYKSGALQALPQSLLDNLQHVADNGVQIIFRFQQAPSVAALQEDEAFHIRQYAEFCGWVANQLKGKVDVWAIGNEQNFGARKSYGVEEFPAVYARMVKAAAQEIKAVDPLTPIEIETALFDFGWTEEIMEEGLDEIVDIMGVHVYKERPKAVVTPEAVGTFIHNGERRSPSDQPYSNYAAEVEAYKQLLAGYNPDIQVWITETSINTGEGAYNVTWLSQAKFLSRLYIYHYMLGLGPTNWWSLDPVKTGESEWGLTDFAGVRKPAWYALRNVSALFDSSLRPVDLADALEHSGSIPEWTDGAFENADRQLLYVPYWSAVPMSDENTGMLTDIRLERDNVVEIEAVDMLTGTVQAVEFTKEAGAVLMKDMIVRDYPIVLVIKTGSGEAPQAGEAPGVPVLSDDNGYDYGIRDGHYRIAMNMWWGSNADTYKLYENGVLVNTQALEARSPGAQSAVTLIKGKPNGTYRYYAELSNSSGTTRSGEWIVEVIQAEPGKPVLSHNNWGQEGSFQVRADMWWGVNGSIYRLYENGELVDTRQLAVATPLVQTVITELENKAPGRYIYVCELENEAGVARSESLAVEVR
ncbi:discoidin domain-containing protein [Paenibacillus sp. YN15]|uniref:discoidin domain-containing protein n=1 Tax=Paenibacillus sp. YN15 TaxID=1742774 RepID=UPI000DCCC7CD|nr:discoidin domain-containing protein [Paenibacillus sp. YN15]RAU94695.1 hypothetical protein DQG13_23240 [Paenibacillus sp. YN15]